MLDRLEPELLFWKNDIAKYPGEDYGAIRASNYIRLLESWPEMANIEGRGLDLGCGPVSMFENSGLDMYACDPLMEQYQQLYHIEKPNVKYVLGHKDDGSLPFINGFFDFVVCVNVIDHTPHHKKLLTEIARVLRSDGWLYLMVNFDNELLTPNHAMLWNASVVAEELSSFFCLLQITVWNAEHQKYMYWGKYRNGGESSG